jgi:acetyl-CoA carboxylase biotin carboxyl carrier protein
MNLKELKELIDLVTSKDSIEELEIERSGVRLRIKRAASGWSPSMVSAPIAVPAGAGGPVAHTPPAVQIVAEGDDLMYIKSPIVGTFYKAATPTADPFVSVGDFVEKGAVLCIIEAMKLMNEIESEVSGEVVAVLVDNGQPVEYGEKLFAIRPR